MVIRFFRPIWHGIKKYWPSIVSILAFILAIISTFFPNTLSVGSKCISQSRYDRLSSQFSQPTKDYIAKYINDDTVNYNDFLFGIPDDITEKERIQIYSLLNHQENAPQWLFPLFLAIILLLVVSRELTSARKYAIAHSTKLLHDAIHIVKDGWSDIFEIEVENNCSININRQKAAEYITKSLTSLEHYYSIVTGTPCRVCIKTLNTVDSNNLQDVKIYTFARSIGSHSSTPAAVDNENDTVRNNSDFGILKEKDHNFCLYDNIDKDPSYCNSHLDPLQRDVKPSKQLGYKSTLSFPIRKAETIANGKPKYSYLGFLCIDSKHSKVFDERLDVYSGLIVADFYYLFINKYIEIIKRNGEKLNG